MKKILNFLLELFLPRSEGVKMLESVDPETFIRTVPKAESIKNQDTLALFDYKHPLVKTAIWELKYRGNKKILNLLTNCLYNELVSELSERKTFENFEKPILIPIPMSKPKQRKRGFNQCELLADSLFKMDNNRSFETQNKILIKTRETESQTRKNRTERLLNLKNSFAVINQEKIFKRNIILLDDVTTTGATFEEARKILSQAGAKKIFCVAIGH